MTQRECSKLHYFADKRQLPHSRDYAVHVYATKLWENMLVHSLFFPCSFLVLSSFFLSLLVPCSFLMCLTAVLTEIKETKESCLSNRKRLQETHLKVPRKASRKFHKGVYYSRNFPAVLSVHLWCVFMSAFWNYVSNRGRFSFVSDNFRENGRYCC